MNWLIITILSYFIFATVSLLDKYLLTRHIPNPKVYAFYVGILGIWALVLIPFVNFLIPDFITITLSLLAGAIFTFFLYGYFSALNLFEASRVIPAIGGLSPLFSFGIIYIFSFGEEILSFFEIIAFLLLTLGSVLMMMEKEKFITLKSLQLSSIASLLGALSFVLSKYVFLAQPFWSGMIWIRIGAFLAALFFLFSKEVRKEVFLKRIGFKKNTATIFLLDQVMGAVANILYEWAVALVPLASLAIISALSGIQYVFLFIFITFLSFKSPQILKEKISKEILFQKIGAILLIGTGLAVLALK
jgi:hypothetical protein